MRTEGSRRVRDKSSGDNLRATPQVSRGASGSSTTEGTGISRPLLEAGSQVNNVFKTRRGRLPLYTQGAKKLQSLTRWEATKGHAPVK